MRIKLWSSELAMQIGGQDMLKIVLCSAIASALQCAMNSSRCEVGVAVVAASVLMHTN